MASASPKRGLFRLLAAIGAVVLVAGIVMFMIASRQVNLAAYDAQAAMAADGVTTSGTSNPKAYIEVDLSSSCDATADASGAWSCQLPGSAAGTDVGASATDASDNDVSVNAVALAGDGVTVSGTTTANAAVTATASTSCTTTADSSGAWSCTVTPIVGGDMSSTATDPVLSLGLGIAAAVLICLGALAAIIGGVGMVLTGGQPIGLMSLLLIPIGVALDFALAALNNLLRLPLFLDSVGHILAGILGGPVIGGVTGWLGVMTNSAFQPAAVVWSFQGASIGVVVGLLAQAGMFKTPGRTVLSGLIVIATSATLSSVISLVVYGGIDGYAISFLRVALTKVGWSMSSAVVVTSVIIELIDKTISVGLPAIVVFNLSSRFLNLFVTGSKLRDMKTEAIPDSASADELAEAARTTTEGYGSYDEKADGDK